MRLVSVSMFKKLRKTESGSLKAAAEILERLEYDYSKVQNVSGGNRSSVQQKPEGVLHAMRRKA